MATYFPLFVTHDAPSVPMSDTPERGLLHRFFQALTAARAQPAESEIGQYIEGWGITNTVARDADWRFLSRL